MRWYITNNVKFWTLISFYFVFPAFQTGEMEVKNPLFNDESTQMTTSENEVTNGLQQAPTPSNNVEDQVGLSPQWCNLSWANLHHPPLPSLIGWPVGLSLPLFFFFFAFSNLTPLLGYLLLFVNQMALWHILYFNHMRK